MVSASFRRLVLPERRLAIPNYHIYPCKRFSEESDFYDAPPLIREFMDLLVGRCYQIQYPLLEEDPGIGFANSLPDQPIGDVIQVLESKPEFLELFNWGFVQPCRGLPYIQKDHNPIPGRLEVLSDKDFAEFKDFILGLKRSPHN